MARRICLVTPGNLAANPRIVKEADALQDAGYEVTAVVSDYSQGLRRFDDEISGQARWRVVRAPRASSERYVRAAARVAAKVIDGVGVSIPSAIAAPASGGPVAILREAACGVAADLYIAHYTAALPAAGAAAERYGALLGFDAEDFHSGEGDGSPAESLRMATVRAVEAKWLPRCKHLTAASPLIAKAYASAYGVQPVSVLNVFPLKMAPHQPAAPRPAGAPLRAYWFSQTIGLDRGLQPFLQAMAVARTSIELDLRGADPWAHGAALLAMARDLGLADRVRVLPMASPDEMVRLAAAYDLGLSLETDVSENRRLCLTNKIFTYLLAGVPVVMSDTPAQRQLAPDLGEAAAVVSLSDPAGIAMALDRLAGGLEAAKAHATRLGRERYNWETEKRALLASVETAFARGGR
ncbi:MAG: glycosyltransferase [Reyranella sp.]|uniref:glycosyltransferase n=1 Tax=Reyranella sp. TaxID=1929291 RepID=UPI001ACB9EEC|nr:glycosyltransferase [Reyranella sp.]MBN9088930.1 glycosyltransferase [Reyranella sp.]